jgi:hypothetical protein
MGYTHYIYQKSRFDDAAWKKIMTETLRICEAAKTAGIRLAGPDGSGLPEITDNEIALNGIAPDENHESFILTQKPQYRNAEAPSPREKAEGAFTFCKTARKPYDAIVVSILAFVKRIAPSAVEIGSDGGNEAIQNQFPIPGYLEPAEA